MSFSRRLFCMAMLLANVASAAERRLASPLG